MRPSLRTIATLVAALALASCGLPSPQSFDEQRASDSAAEVRTFADRLAADLSRRGPLGWLDHFDHSPEFFMASDGVEVFPDFATAEREVRSFAPSIEAMEIAWDSLRVDFIPPDRATFATGYRESLTDTTGAVHAFGGYVTASLARRRNGWRILSLHWSSPREAARED